VLLDPLEKSTRAAGSSRPRVLMTTEGTYPHVIGGVSSWCDLLIGGLPEIHWQVLPIVAARNGDGPAFEVPEHADLLGAIELWSPEPPRRRGHSLRRVRAELPSVLVRELIGWNGTGRALTDALVWCRRHPAGVRPAFRSRRGWERYLAILHEILHEEVEDSALPPELDTVEAATLYQTLYWIARAAAVPTPDTDLLHVTAAGWAAVPAIVHKELEGTPILLTEHGVYVREAYLAAARSQSSPGRRFIATRLARGLTLAAYESANVVAPVSDANARWETALGIDPGRIQVIHNGVDAPGAPTAAPRTARVVAIGRIDPLKDVHTMLRVAVEVTKRLPDARFMYYGPVSPGQEAYGRTCTELHEQLGLGDRFRFMGSTRDVPQVLRDADVLLMTSISEGMPMGILEAMSHARPVVATAVGGVPEVLRGCGIVAPSGDVHGLSVALTTLLADPALASGLGRRGHETVGRKFTRSRCLDQYRDLIAEMSAPRPRLVSA
jgi:polysaccharide biosynthesis protein PelF